MYEYHQDYAKPGLVFIIDSIFIARKIAISIIETTIAVAMVTVP